MKMSYFQLFRMAVANKMFNKMLDTEQMLDLSLATIYPAETVTYRRNVNICKLVNVPRKARWSE